jgi:hypothetical protein
MAGGDLGADVANHLFAEAHVPPQQGEQVFIGPARAVEPQMGDDEAFLEDLLAQAGALSAADIDVVHAVDREADQPLPDERRHGDEDIRGLAIGQPRVVADEDVARPDRGRRNGLQQGFAKHRHHTHMAERGEPGLGDQEAAVVIEPGRHVVDLDHVVGESGPHQGRRHLIRDRDQPRPQDLQRQVRRAQIALPSPGLEVAPGTVIDRPWRSR